MRTIQEWKHPRSLQDLRNGEAARVIWPATALDDPGPRWREGWVRYEERPRRGGGMERVPGALTFFHYGGGEIELSSPSQVEVMR